MVSVVFQSVTVTRTLLKRESIRCIVVVVVVVFVVVVVVVVVVY